MNPTADTPTEKKESVILAALRSSLREVANRFEKEAIGMEATARISELISGMKDAPVTPLEREAMRRQVLFVKMIARSSDELNKEARALLAWVDEELAKP